MTPTPAASVGVAIPKVMLPMIAKTTIKNGHILRISIMILVNLNTVLSVGARGGWRIHLK